MRLVEDLADFPCEVITGERFLKKRQAFLQQALAKDRFVGIAGNVEYLHARPRGEEAHGEGVSIHAGHDDVAKKQIDWAMVAGGEEQSFIGCGGLEGPVAAGLEKFASHLAECSIVLDDQDGLRALRWPTRVRS